jgi:4-hydroxy-2-oxoheptanedioate aldolase
VLLKQLLDIGVQSLLIPMVDTVEQAESVVRAVRYPPRGVRGVGSALGRASRWNRDAGYLARADEGITVLVQVETQRGLDQLEGIVTVDGIDGVFIGPADLAASLGHLGQQDHPEVIDAVETAIKTVTALGKAAGVNAFAEPLARRYLDAGCRFALVGADVTLLARGSERLAATYIPEA